ncbi:MAG TPA: DNA primase [Candidatus Microsaccharimonas sp.]|nr:DNA primase [Candidatus Microsaccharimonas sp.]
MDAVDEVKARLNIEDVIGEYVQLKRAGRNWKGLSPFGNEKTPSFVVSPEKQIWHDFSSGRGGSVFNFVMEMEGVDFKGALELLARKAGVDLEQYRTASQGSRGPNKERLYQINEAAAHFYQVQFSKNKVALEYVFKKRQFTKETALEWRLGYSPNTGDALIKFLASKGFTPAEMKQAGVTAQRYSNPSDMFRGRLMIPLQDPQGRVIGFTARLLEDNPNAPKYINTPQTVLYDKSRHVYGLHLAKEAIRKKKYVVITEGNLDVIASHQVGVREVVATAGTAMTEPNLKALGRFTGDVRLAYDADKAGMNATERAIPIASRVKVSLQIITIPTGKDPDELIKQDASLWEKVIQEPQYALDWLMERYQTQLDLTSAQGKRQYSDVLLPVVRALTDPVEQDHYLVAIAKAIGVSREALDNKLQQGGIDEQRPLKRPKVAPKPIDRKLVEDLKAQDQFLAIMLLQPKTRDYLELIEPGMLFQEPAMVLLDFLKRHEDFSGDPAVAKELREVADYVRIISLQYEELYQGLELTELRYEAARLQTRLVEQYVKNQKQTLTSQLADVDDATTRAVLEQVKQLDNLLNQVKGR